MSNYSLVIDSTFKPFSYQELMAPVTRMSDYHEKLAQEYDTLSSQADILEAMGKDDRDKESGAYSRYKAYSDNLRKEANDLYRYGVNTESRRILSDVRRRYNTDIVPIQNAWNKRIKEAEAQQTAENNNPFLRFSRRAADTNIDYYVDNPEGGYDVYDLKNVYTMTSSMAKNLAKQAREGRKEYIDDVTYRFITPYGLDPNLINDWQTNPNASPTLTNMVNQALASNGISEDNPIYQEALNIAKLGTWDAIGDDKEHMVEDYSRKAAISDHYATKQKLLTSKLSSAAEAGYDYIDSTYELPMQGATKDGGKATSVSVKPLHYEKSDWNNLSKSYKVREITNFKNNTAEFSTDNSVTLGNLLDRKDSDKKDINVVPFWGKVNGKQGLILATNENGKDHRYFIDAETMPESQILQVVNAYNDADLFERQGNTQARDAALSVARRALHSSFTTHEPSYEQKLINQGKNNN